MRLALPIVKESYKTDTYKLYNKDTLSQINNDTA